MTTGPGAGFVPAGDERVALVGANGTLARAVRRLAPAGWRVFGLDLPEFDVTDGDRVRAALDAIVPTLVINCAADTDVDGCEARESRALSIHRDGVAHLAAAALRHDAVLVHISTDFVFDGAKSTPYVEDDPPAPLSAYGRTKLAGERAALASGLRRCFVVRTSWLFGRGGRGFVPAIARLAGERDELRVVADQVGSPTYADDLAGALVELVGLARRAPDPEGRSSTPFGTYHVANRGACSRHELAEAIVAHPRVRATARARTIVPVGSAEFPTAARRPAYSALSTARFEAATGRVLPTWQDALRRYLDADDPAPAGNRRGDP